MRKSDATAGSAAAQARLARLRDFVPYYLPDHRIDWDLVGDVADLCDEAVTSVIENRLKRGDHRKILLCIKPPKSGKTTIVSHAMPLAALARCPDLRILFISEKVELAASNLAFVRSEMENNERYIADFGEKKPSGRGTAAQDKWAVTQIIVADRKKTYMEPSIRAQGVRNFPNRLHFDLIVIDDPHARGSLAWIDKVWKTIEDAYWRLDDWGAILSVCTPWAPWDFSERMQRLWTERLTSAPIITPACVDDDNGNPISLFPNRWSSEQLKKEKSATAPDEWLRMMELKVGSAAGRIFDPTKYVEVKDPVSMGLRWAAIIVDPRGSDSQASTDSTSASNDSVAVMGLTQTGLVVRLDGVTKKARVTELVEETRRMILKWSIRTRLRHVAVEDTAITRALFPQIQRAIEELRVAGIQVPQTTTAVRPRGREKEERIRGMQYDYNRSYLVFAEQMEDRAQLRQELFGFPGGRNWDALDATAYFYDLLAEDKFPRFRTETPLVTATKDEISMIIDASKKGYGEQMQRTLARRRRTGVLSAPSPDQWAKARRRAHAPSPA